MELTEPLFSQAELDQELKPELPQECRVGPPGANIISFSQTRHSTYKCGMIDSYRGTL